MSTLRAWLQVEQVDRRRVFALDQADFQPLHEPGRRHPEIIADQDDRLNVLAVALPQRGDQLGRSARPMGKEPLLELIQDQEDFCPAGAPAAPQARPARQPASVGRQVGTDLWMPRSKRASVSSGVAST